MAYAPRKVTSFTVQYIHLEAHPMIMLMDVDFLIQDICGNTTTHAVPEGAPLKDIVTSVFFSRQAGHHDLADRLVEIQYELTDRLAFYLCGRKPGESQPCSLSHHSQGWCLGKVINDACHSLWKRHFMTREINASALVVLYSILYP